MRHKISDASTDAEASPVFCAANPQRGTGGNGLPSFSDKGASHKNFLFRFLGRAVVLFGEGKLYLCFTSIIILFFISDIFCSVSIFCATIS